MKSLLKKYILILILLFVYLGSHAQTIQNVDFEQKGNKIDITWQMQGLEVAEVVDIKIYYRIGSNIYYGIPIGNMSGHYGKVAVSDVPANGIINAKATWDVLNSMDKLQGELNFKVMATIEKSFSNTFTDKRDGKRYKQVAIGNQVWMAENLAYKPNVGNYWVYNNDIGKVSEYGYLYDWETSQKVCPNGWHLPTDAEWEQLARYISDDKGPYGKDNDDWENVGKHLKSKSGWGEGININDNGTDDYGFSGFPFGRYRSSQKAFLYMNQVGTWWSATEATASTMAWGYLLYMAPKLNRSDYRKETGCSVRCVRD